MTKEKTFQPRLYRELMGNERWISFRVNHLETDLWIATSGRKHIDGIERFTYERIVTYRKILDNHIAKNPDFLTSLIPLPVTSLVHPMILAMHEASDSAGTGPMSAVAGAFAEYIAIDLMAKYRFEEVVVENGGDIFLKLSHHATISIYAGESPLSDKVGLVVRPDQSPVSVCCSSATVGHSLSFGTADACVVACSSGALADAYATACCNSVKNKAMVQEVTEMFLGKPGVLSVVIIKDDRIGIGGKIEVKLL